MATPFDGRLIWLHWMGDKVGEENIRQLISTVQSFSPNVSGIAIKATDGPQWQGVYDGKRLMAVTGPRAIQSWLTEMTTSSLDLHLWSVLRGRNATAEANLVIQACRVDGVKSMIIDLDVRDWYESGMTGRHAETVVDRIRKSIPDDFHLGISFDPRGLNPSRVFVGNWVPHVDSLHPRIYHWSYSEGLRGPAEYVDEAFDSLAQYNRPIIPILQAFTDPASTTRVPAGQVTAAANRALQRGAPGLLLAYLGAAGPVEFGAVREIELDRPADAVPVIAPPVPAPGDRLPCLVVAQLVELRAGPGLEPRLVFPGEALSFGQRVEVIEGTATTADSHVFVQLSTGWWVVEKKADGSGVNLQPAQVVVAQPTTSEPEPDVISTPDPVAVKRIFLVTEDVVRVRVAPGLEAAALEDQPLLKGEQVEVDPDSRTEADGYVWWQHSRGWSAERKIGGSVYMWPYDPSEGDDLPDAPWRFEKLPLSFDDMRWFYYYGNTVYAFEHGTEHNYDGYSQGLHGGLDFGCPGGPSVVAGVNGVFAGPGRSFGPNRVDVTIGDYRIIYGHLAEPANYPVGTPVTPDTYLGKIDSWAVHVHVEIRHEGRFILNPLQFMSKALRDEIIASYPPVGDRAFYSSPRWNQWLTPLDQPTITLGGPLIGPRAPV